MVGNHGRDGGWKDGRDGGWKGVTQQSDVSRSRQRNLLNNQEGSYVDFMPFLPL